MSTLPQHPEPQGDPPNWAAVVKLSLDHQTDAHRAAKWILGSAGAQDAVDDVVQDAIVKAALQFSSLRDPAKARGWFLTIVSRVAIDYVRAIQRRRELWFISESADWVPQWHAAPNVMPADQFPRLAEALEFVNQLPEKQRVAYLLEHFFGLSRADIAKVLECAVRTVSTHIRRAQAKATKRFPPATELSDKAQQLRLRGRTT